MPIAFTSRLSLAETVSQLAGLQSEVYLCIADYDGANDTGPSIEDIARCLSRKESSICGRVNELLKAGAIEVGPFKTNSTGKAAITYRALQYRAEPIPPRAPSPQQELFGTPSRAFSN